MNAKVLVTGSSGAIGHAVSAALGEAGAMVTGVSRQPVATDADHVTWLMGHDRAPQRLVETKWDVIVNCAADIRFQLDHDVAFDANVASLEALAEVAGAAHVIHMSTAFAPGLAKDVAVSDREAYRNSYEWSKAAAELAANDLFNDQLSIVRPPLVVGSRSDGSIARFNGLYKILRLVASGLAPLVVAEPSTRLQVVSIDDVARLCVELAGGPPSAVPVVLGVRDAPTMETFVGVICDAIDHVRERSDKVAIERPQFVSREKWQRLYAPLASSFTSSSERSLASIAEMFAPYFADADIDIGITNCVDPMADCLTRSMAFWCNENEHHILRGQRVRRRYGG